MADQAATRPDGRPRRLAAFDHWNFRAYFVGQLLSSIGTWMQTFAQGWLVLELTGRSGLLGVTVALQFLPLLLFGAQGYFGPYLISHGIKRPLVTYAASIGDARAQLEGNEETE